MANSSPAPPTDTLQQVVNETRRRFAATFGAQCDAICALVDAVAASGAGGPLAELTQIAHRLRGLAGTIGFATVGAHAAELQELVKNSGSGAFDAVHARAIVEAMREAFAADLPRPPVWPPPPRATAPGAKILVAEDEPGQFAIVAAGLEVSGYVPTQVVSGDVVVEVARAEKPAVILLNIALPGLDGYAVCKLLKADPELCSIPVIFLTTRAHLDDRLTGLALGADEFLSKPVDMRELVLRIELLLKRNLRRSAVNAGDPRASKELAYDAFLDVLREALGRSAAALAIVRVPVEGHEASARVLSEEVRGRDSIGHYGPTRLLILMPEMTASDARERLEPMVRRLAAHGLRGVCGGVSGATGPRATTAEALIAEADEALAEARYLGVTTAIWSERQERPAAPAAVRTVVLAEDDPDVTRIVDAQVRAAGHKTIIAFDGEQTLAAVNAHAPDVLVLDLMMPKLDGFDVLARLREGVAPRPRIIVLSGRGREQDVVRAFELGADDYMTKPFNPQELMARVARLLK